MSSNPIRALLARGSIYTLATALQLSGALIVLPAITRLLSPDEYGVVALAVVIQQLLAFAGGLGLSSVVTRDYFIEDRGPEVARKLVSTTLIPATALVVVAEVTGPEWSKIFSDLEYGTALRIAVFSALPMAVVLSCQGLLRAADRAGAYVFLAVLCGVGGQAIGLLCLIALDGGPIAFIAGLCSSVAVAAAAGLVLTGAIRFSVPDRQVVREALAIGAPTVMHNLAGYLLAFGNRIVIERVAGVGSVGRYQVAYGVGGAVIYLIQAVNNAWAPLVFGAGDERRWRTLADTTGALSLVTGLVVGGLALAAPLALIVAAPSDYDPEELAPVCALIALSAVPFVAYLAGSHIVFWRGRTTVLAWATPVSAALNLALVAVLVPPLGLEGAGLASIAGYSLLALCVRWRAQGMAEVPWRRDRTVIGVAAGSALVAAGVFLPADGAWLAVRGLAAAIVGLFLIRLVRRLLAEDQLPSPGDEHHPPTEDELETQATGRPIL
jgi:O-antigen/teichoic acid export membrane protein